MKKIFKILILFCGLLLAGCKSGQKITDAEGFEVVPVGPELLDLMLAKKVFSDHSPVPVERLRLIRVKHYDFDGQVRTGELVMLDACSESVSAIFQELYRRRFPVHRVKLLTEYEGNDSLSMAANNTSGHNLRRIAGQQNLSLHAYGAAIDLNPMQNPFVDIPCTDTTGHIRIMPVGSSLYTNRSENRPGKAKRRGLAEEVVDVFARQGFYTWGGHWSCPIDYQHFQLSRSMAKTLVTMDSTTAARFFKRSVRYFNKYGAPLETALEKRMGGRNMAEFYQQSPAGFEALVSEIDRFTR